MLKRRINLIIGKKQLILAGLVILLGAAVYVNYLLSAPKVETDTKETANYGDVQFVSSDKSGDTAIEVSATNSDAYFAQARLDKRQSRDEAVEMLQSFYFGGDSTGDELAVIAQNVAAVGNYIETETKVENLLKAQGFAEALCYLSDTSANVIVKTDGLDTAQAAQIKSTLLGEIAVPAENITIVEIK